MKKYNNFYVADFETITSETKYYKKHKRTGIVYGYIQSIGNEKHFTDFNDIGDMLKWLMDKKINTVTYFHNLSFDGVFILDWLGMNNYTCVDEIDNESQFKVFRTSGSKIYKILVSYKHRNKIKYMTFLCSKLILSCSVEALGINSNMNKFIGDQKEDSTFYDREPEETVQLFYAKNKEYCEYCKRDVKIVIAALLDFLNAVTNFLIEIGEEDNIDYVLESFTISSMGLKIQQLMLKQNGLETEDIQMRNLEDRMYMDKFTNGGLTVNNLKYSNIELKDIKGYVIDLKSAYPAVMFKELPYGDMYLSKPNQPHCEFQEIYYESIWPKNHTIPLLKNWNAKPGSSNYFLSAKNYTTYLLKEEAEELEKLYNFTGKRIIKCVYFKTKPYLSKFIEKMFYYKEYYKKQNELGKSHTFKIFLNSAYGIHAKRFDFNLVLPFMGTDTYENNGIEYKINLSNDLNKPTRHTYIPNNNLYAYKPIFKENMDLEVITSHKAIANYITAKTRIKLLKGIIHFGPDNFVYCDTDSLFLINHNKDYIKQYCGNKLGDWEIEGEDNESTFDEGYFIRSKLYQIVKKGKIVKTGSAGFTKGKVKIPQLLLENKVEIVNATLYPLRVPGGIILISRNKFLSNIPLPALTNYECDPEFEQVWKRHIENERKKAKTTKC